MNNKINFSQESNTLVYIIILNYNNWEDTIECVESVLNSDYKNYQIILIDNNSPNNSEERIKEYLEGKRIVRLINPFYKSKIKERKGKLPYVYHINSKEGLGHLTSKEKSAFIDKYPSGDLKYPISFIQTNKNLGFAGGNNVALKWLLSKKNIHESSKVLLLNPDTFISKKSLQEFSKIEKGLFVSSCTIKDYHNPSITNSIGAYHLIKPLGIIRPLRKVGEEKSIDYLYGGVLLTNIRTIRKNGLLPEKYFLYWEETDWCYKAKMAGVELSSISNAIVYDKVGTSTGRGYLAHYYFIRNGLHFYKKYFKFFLPGLFVFNLIRLSNKLRKRDYQSAKAIIDGTRDYFKGKEGYKIIG